MIVLLAMAVALAELFWQGVIVGNMTLGLDSILKVGYGWEPSLIYLSNFNRGLGAIAVLLCGGLIMTSLYPRSLPLAAAFGLLTLGVWGSVLVEFAYFLPREGWRLAALGVGQQAIDLAATCALTAILFSPPFARAVWRAG